jgi:hypothetical protein
MIYATRTPAEYKVPDIKPLDTATLRSDECRPSSPSHPRPSGFANPIPWIVSAALPWLCLLVAIWFLAFEFQLTVGARTSDAGNLSVANATAGEPSVITHRLLTPASPIGPHGELTQTSTQECDDMSTAFPADILVGRTMEELEYLESTLCPGSSGADLSHSGE